MYKKQKRITGSIKNSFLIQTLLLFFLISCNNNIEITGTIDSGIVQKLDGFSLSGSITGLDAGGVVTLSLNGSENLSTTGSGTLNDPFTFNTTLIQNVTYTITLVSDPAGQTCVVNTPSGKMGTANITNLKVTCTNNPTHLVQMNVTGVTVAGLILQLDNGPNIGIETVNVPAGGGPINFLTPLREEVPFAVVVNTQPPGQFCTVANPTGNIGIVSPNITISCVNNGISFDIAGNPASGTVNETAGTYNIPVFISSPLAASGTLSYTVTAGTATTPADFTDPGAGSLTVPAGVTTFNLPVTIVDDKIDEGVVDETFTVTLTGTTVSQLTGTLTFTAGIINDDFSPLITDVASSTMDNSYGVGTTVSIQVTFDQVVNVNTGGGVPSIDLNSSPLTNEAQYVSGTGSNVLTFDYIVAAGDSTIDLDYVATTSLVLNGGTIQNATLVDATLTLPAIGAANSLGFQKAIVIDTTAPTITDVTSTTLDGAYSYLPATSIFIQVTFSEPVNVDTLGGTPTIDLNSSVATNEAAYLSGTGTNILIFEYPIAAGDNSLDLDYNTINDLILNGGTIRDAALNDATVTLPVTGAANSLGFQKAIVIDTTSPTITDVTSTTLDGAYSYLPATSIFIQVTFSEPVNVDTLGGTPTIDLNSSVAINEAAYLSGTGTNILIFEYPIAAGDNSLDLDYNTINDLILNGGTIRDAALNDATVALPAIGALNSLGAQKTIVIDTVAPTVTIDQAVAQLDPVGVFPIDFTIVFSEAVTTPPTVVQTGTATGITWGVATTADNITWNIQATGAGSIAGNVIPVVNASNVQDAAGNWNSASTSTDNSVRLGTLIAHFPFDNLNLANDIINVAASTPNGGVALSSDRRAVNTSSYSFSGVAADYISLPNYTIIDISPPISFSAWVNPDTTIDNNILFTDVWQNGYQLQVKLGGTVNCGFGDGATQRNFVTTDTVSSGRWHHIACSITDSNTIEVYIDGKLAVGGAYSGTGTVPAFTASQGSTGGELAGVNLFKGQIDDIKVYNYVRTATDVQLDYNVKKWDGGAGTVNWADAANWTGDTVPIAGQDVIIDHTYVAAATPINITIPVGITTVGNFEVDQGGGAAITVSLDAGANLKVNHHFDVLSGAITGTNPGGGTITLAGSTDGPFRFNQGATAIIATNIEIDTNAAVDTTGVKTYQLQAATTIDGNLTILNGTLDTTASNWALNVQGPAPTPAATARNLSIGTATPGVAKLNVNSSITTVSGSFLRDVTNGVFTRVASGSNVILTGTGTVSGFDGNAVAGPNSLWDVSAAAAGYTTTVGGLTRVYNQMTTSGGTFATTAPQTIFLYNTATSTVNNPLILSLAGSSSVLTFRYSIETAVDVLVAGGNYRTSTVIVQPLGVGVGSGKAIFGNNITGVSTFWGISRSLGVTGEIDTNNFSLSAQHLRLGQASSNNPIMFTSNGSTIALSGNLDIDPDIPAVGSTVSQIVTTGGTWNIGQNISNNSTLLHDFTGSTVILNGTAAQTISIGVGASSLAFNNLTLADTGARTITFPDNGGVAGSVVTTVNGVFTAVATNTNEISLVSPVTLTPGTLAEIYVPNNPPVADFLIVQDHAIYGALTSFVHVPGVTTITPGAGGNTEGWFNATNSYVANAGSKPGSDTVGTGSMDRPFATIQKALGMYNCGAGCSGFNINVSGGSYTVDSSLVTPTNLVMKEGVSLKGGYDNTDLTWVGRDITITALPKFVTTITDSTSLAGGTIALPRSVITANNTITTSTVIDGFTITGGPAAFASGIFVDAGSPVIQNNIFNCSNTTNQSFGIKILNAGTNPLILNNIISCTDATGGWVIGIAVDQGVPIIDGNIINVFGGTTGSAAINIPGAGSPVIRNNPVINGGNGANSYGIRMAVSSSSALIHSNPDISGGSGATNSYGIYISAGSTPVIDDNAGLGAGNVINGGSGVSNSYGIYIDDAGAAGVFTPTIRKNAGINGGSGGSSYGIYVTGLNANPTIQNNTITGGTAADTLVVAVSAGVMVTGSASAAIINNLSIDGGTTSSTWANSNSYGVRHDGATLTLTGNTISGGVSQKNSYAFVSGTGTLTVSGNRLYGGTGGVFSVGLSIEGAATGKVFNNLVHGGDSLSGSIALQAWGATADYYNNTVYSGSAPVAWGTRLGGSSTGSNFKNNILFCDGVGTEYGFGENDTNSEPATLQNNDIYNCFTALYYDENANPRTTFIEINTPGSTAQTGAVSGNIIQPVDFVSFTGTPAGFASEIWAPLATALPAGKPAHANVAHGGLDLTVSGGFTNDFDGGAARVDDRDLFGILPTNGGQGWSIGAYEIVADQGSGTLGSVVYVSNNLNPNGDFVNSGMHPGAPVETLNRGYNEIAIPGMTEVDVAAGNYTVDSGAAGTNIKLKNNISLIGGYDSAFALLPNPVANITTIADSVSGADGSSGNNPYSPVEANGNTLANTTIVDGFTIIGDQSGLYNFISAFKIINGAQPAIYNNIVSGGIPAAAGTSYGIYVTDPSTTLFSQPVIGANGKGNREINGGGGGSSSYGIYSMGPGAQPQITFNALVDGGTGTTGTYGIYLGGAAGSVFPQPLIANNTSIKGGTITTGVTSYGVYIAPSTGATIDNNTIDGNTTATGGRSHGIYFGQSTPGQALTVNVSNNIVHGGQGVANSYGMYVSGASAKPTIGPGNSIYGGNGNANTWISGGSIGIQVTAGALPLITQNTLIRGSDNLTLLDPKPLNSQAIAIREYGYTSTTGVTINSNTSIEGGDGTNNSVGIIVKTQDAQALNHLIEGNTAILGGNNGGGSGCTSGYGIYLFEDTTTLVNSSTIGGVVPNGSISGGSCNNTYGIYLRGPKTNPTISNNTLITGGIALNGESHGIGLGFSANGNITGNAEITGGNATGAGKNSNGIKVDSSTATITDNGLINGGTATAWARGIVTLASTSSPVTVERNKILAGVGTSQSMGIVLGAGSLNAANNMIHGGDSTFISNGVQFNPGTSGNVYNNTIYSGAGTTEKAGVRILNSNGTNLANNIIFCDNAGTAIGIKEGAAGNNPATVQNNNIFACPTALYADADGNGNLTAINDVNYNVKTGAFFSSGNISVDLDPVRSPTYAHFAGFSGTNAGFSGETWSIISLNNYPANLIEGGLNLAGVTTDYTNTLNIRTTGITHNPTNTNPGGYTMGAFENDVTNVLQITITTTAVPVNTGICSGAVTFRADSFDGVTATPYNLPAATDFNVTTDSTTMTLYNGPGCVTPLLGPISLTGLTTGTISFKDTSAGYPGIKVDNPYFQSASQNQTINGVVPNIKLVAVGNTTLAEGGPETVTFTAYAVDPVDNTTPVVLSSATTITLSSVGVGVAPYVADANDFLPISPQIVIPGGGAQGSVTFSANDDSEVEPDQSLQVTGFTNDKGYPPSSPAFAPITFTVVDNDRKGLRVLSADYYDIDGNGHIDHLKIVFDEIIEESTFNVANWGVSGYTIQNKVVPTGTGPDLLPDGSNDAIVWVLLQESPLFDTGSKPDLTASNATVTPAFSLGYTINCQLNATSGTCVHNATGILSTVDVVEGDKARPVIVSAVDNSTGTGVLRITFSESVTSTTGVADNCTEFINGKVMSAGNFIYSDTNAAGTSAIGLTNSTVVNPSSCDVHDIAVDVPFIPGDFSPAPNGDTIDAVANQISDYATPVANLINGGTPVTLNGTTHSITVNVTGLTGPETVTLQLNGSSSMTTTTGGTFAQLVVAGQNFAVGIKKDSVTGLPMVPAGKVCAFSGTQLNYGSLISTNISITMNCVNGFRDHQSVRLTDPAISPATPSDIMQMTNLGSTGFGNPSGIVKVGNQLYVADTANIKVTTLPATTYSNVLTPALAAGAGLSDIVSDGVNIYASDANLDCIYKISMTTPTSGTSSVLAGNCVTGAPVAVDGDSLTARFNQPQGLVIDDTYLYIAERANNKIRRLNLTTGIVDTLATFGAECNQPSAIALAEDTLYATCFASHRIMSVNKATGLTAIYAGTGVAGSTDGDRSFAQISGPYGIASDDKALYVTNWAALAEDSALRKIDLATGQVSSIVPNQKPTPSLTGDVADFQTYGTGWSYGVYADGKDIYFTLQMTGSISVRRLSTGLVAHYKLAGDTLDYSGNNLVSTPSGTGISSAEGPHGSANGSARFDGVNGNILIPHSAGVTDLDNSIDDMTISAWVRVPVSQTLQGGDLNPGNAFVSSFDGLFPVQSAFEIGVLNSNTGTNAGLAYMAIPGAGAYGISLTKINDGRYHHITGKYVALTGVVRLYVDGRFEKQGTVASTAVAASGFSIASTTSSTTKLDGTVSDVRIYRRALSDPEITRLSAQIPDGLVAYFPLDDATTVTTDYSVFANNATKVGAPALVNDRYSKPSSAIRVNVANYFNTTANYLPSGVSSRSICVWTVMETPAIAVHTYVPFNYGSNGVGTHNALTLFGSPTDIRYSATGGVNLVTPAKYVEHDWIHLCGVVKDNGTTTPDVSLYKDGLMIGAGPTALATLASTTIGIGGFGTTAANNLVGIVDDARIYNRALSDKEINILADKPFNPTDGLVAWYPLDDGPYTTSIKDHSGNNNHGIPTNNGVVGAPLLSSNGPNGGSNGAFDFYQSGNVHSNVNPTTKTKHVSMSAWVKWAGPSTPAANQIIFFNGNTSINGYGFYINPAGNITGICGLVGFVDSGLSLPLNTWVHVAVVQNGPGWKIFVNGKNSTIGDGCGTGGIAPTNGVTIGSNQAGGEIFNGAIADARIYDRGLSDLEVGRLATQVSESLVAYYPLDEIYTVAGTNNYTRDLSLNTIDGTLGAAGVGDVNEPQMTTDRFGFTAAMNFIPVGAPPPPPMYITGTTGALLPQGASARTVCNWYKVYGYPPTAPKDMFMLDYGGSLNPSSHVLSDTQSYFFTNSVNDMQFPRAPAQFVWTHICTVYDGTNLTLYVNGRGVNTTTGVTLTTGNGPLQIGKGTNISIKPFNGAMDDVRIYSRALTATEVRALSGYNPMQVTSWNPTAASSSLLLQVPQETITCTVAPCVNLGTVNGWNDISGQGNHLSVLTAPPSYTTAGTGGKPAVQFASTLTPLLMQSLGRTTLTGTLTTSNYSYFVVGRRSITATANGLLAFQSLALTGGIMSGFNASDLFNSYAWGVAGTTHNSTTVFNSTLDSYLITDSYDSLNFNVWQSGILDSSVSQAGINTLNVNGVGIGSNPSGWASYGGTVSEVLFFNNALAVPGIYGPVYTDREIVECYLSARYGIPIGHKCP